MYIFLTLFTIANGFIIRSGDKLNNIVLHSSAPPVSPPTGDILVDLGGDNQDIRHLTKEKSTTSVRNMVYYSRLGNYRE